jgi:tRNA pseudouridine13 synthase
VTGYSLPDWQRNFGESLLVCQIKKENADFQVSEQLGFALSGDGEHDYLKIEKDGANTAWVAGGLARYAGIAASEVGFSGLKDRHAVTTQWFSVHRPAGNNADWTRLDLEGSGNHFRITLGDVGQLRGSLDERLLEIRHAGVPNYFGEQRFGRGNGNLGLACDLFAGRRLSRGNRSMALSAARSFLFNHILEDRIRNSTWNALQAGDCASLDGSGSIFDVTELDEELRRRCDELDIHPSGALWGNGPLQTRGTIAAKEHSIVSRFPELMEGLAHERVRHGRRSLRLAVRHFTWERDNDRLFLEFYLMRGGFATAVLREIAAYQDASELRTGPGVSVPN